MTPQELKESILLLAAQGKLVSQLETEGLGQDVISEISSQRASLEIIGQLKKRKLLPEISEDEIPFDIPESWVWVRVYDLADVCETPFADGPFGSNLKSEHYTLAQEVRIIQLSNIGENGWKDQNVRYTTLEHLKTIKRSEVAPGDIVIAKMMPAGRAIIVPEGESKYVLSSDAVKIVAHPILDKMYLYYVINSQAFRKQVYSEVQGITRVRTSLQKLIKYLLPIPPLSEQKRIVAKIEELLPYIDRYEKAWRKLEDFNKCFPGDMQKSILQMAMQGKLVEQRSEEGRGEDLYHQIQAEKQRLTKIGNIKKEKPLQKILEDEKAFDIPESWIWVRLSSICKSITDGDHQAPPQVSSGVPFLVISNLSSGVIDFSNTRLVPQDYFDKLSRERVPEKGDLIFTVTGSYGIPVKVDCDVSFCFQRHMALIKHSIDKEFLFYLLKSPVVKEQCDKAATGTAQKTVGLNSLRNIIVPLPPLAEQKRIVEKLEEILPLCNNLKK